MFGCDVKRSLKLIDGSINCDILGFMMSCDASYILVNKSDLLDNRPEIRNACTSLTRRMRVSPLGMFESKD